MRSPSDLPRPPNHHRPAHPTLKANILIIGVVIAIVVLAMISTFGPG
jgi:hypothetical protein